MRTISEDPHRLDRASRIVQKVYRTIHVFPFLPSARQYNLTISSEKKFVWFRVAKVGTRTLLNHFKECRIELDVEHANSVYYSPNLYRDHFKFAFVRNPWERLLSCWKDKVMRQNYFRFSSNELNRMKSFSNFVEYVETLDIDTCEKHIRSQSALIDLNVIDYLGRIERFDEDTGLIFDKLKLPQKEIISRNVFINQKKHKDSQLRNPYDQNLIERVGEIYKKDIQIFGYTFG